MVKSFYFVMKLYIILYGNYDVNFNTSLPQNDTIIRIINFHYSVLLLYEFSVKIKLRTLNYLEFV